MTQTLRAVAPEQNELILKKAFLRTVTILDLSRTQVEAILGVSPATVSRLMNADKYPQQIIDPKKKEGEIALTVIRIFRSLDALFGGNGEQVRLWIHSFNNHLAEKPIHLLASIRGLHDVANYLDAVRGKV